MFFPEYMHGATVMSVNLWMIIGYRFMTRKKYSWLKPCKEFTLDPHLKGDMEI